MRRWGKRHHTKMKAMRIHAVGRRREQPKEGGDYGSRLRGILIAVAFSAIYLFSVWFRLTEAERRSVTLEIPAAGTDYLCLDVNVVNVDLLPAVITTRITFQVVGQLAQDELTPATDLQLVLNTARGGQQRRGNKSAWPPGEQVVAGEASSSRYEDHVYGFCPGVVISRLKILPGRRGVERLNRNRTEPDAFDERHLYLGDHNGDDGGVSVRIGVHGCTGCQ
jgi:hypothetical protein